ncbi:hypothetical protein BN946_scf184994.g67 [Trametes cinnabarina]|uniref:Uncharacterized protein n=1 Tax=Pycnoporus cinnabarinus TaxID=5643 RepID=A0A060SKV0_PYCCI|nr:hypothetical protein BN946_scf184994.g67 [Trametes cinnabarina]
MSAADAVKQLEQQLEQLKKKVPEEAEHKRQQEEAARKREEERAQAKKRKAPESDDESDSGEEVEQELGPVVLLVVGVDPEVLLQSLVDSLGLSVALRMISGVWQEDGEGEWLGEVDGEERGEGEGKGKGKAVARTRSLEPRAPGAELGVSPGEGPATLALARKGRAWSTDPESLSDRELIEHLLVEGQRTRLALHQVWRYLDEEIEVREDVFASELRNIRAGVRSSVRTELSKMEAVVREVVRDEVAKALAAYFGNEGSSPNAEKEDEAAMEKEGEGLGTGSR